MKNEAAFLLEAQRLKILPCKMPEPKAGEVLIRMEYCGICGSDVGYYRNGRIGRREVTFPYILGHECTGEVIGLGAGVKEFSPGDKVVLEPGLGCGHCEYCMSGRYNLCPDMVFLATPPYHGAFRRYMSYPARGCFKLPPEVSSLEGAMIEPLAVGLHAARQAETDHGKTVLITGMGCIGLMTLLACRSMNAQTIIVSDVFDNRLEKALSLGADHAINVACESLQDRLMELTGGRGADIVFETAGRPETAAQAVYLVARGGIIMQVGTISDPVPYQFNELAHNEAQIRSSFRYCNIFPLALRLIRRGAIDLNAVGPDVFPFDQAASAFVAAASHGDEHIKCILKF